MLNIITLMKRHNRNGIAGLEKLDNIRRKRYCRTMSFLIRHVTREERIIDLGTTNPLSELMRVNGYNVVNTMGEDLDIEYTTISEYQGDVTTSFELFEHLLAPFNILREIKTPKLIASVPLKLWFAEAYWNESSEWDRHYHEFEKKQFDWLLEKSGWRITDSEMWTAPVRVFGLKPFLRLFTNRYYIVCCERTAR